MKQDLLNLYYVDMKYIRELHNVDDKVMSVSPQIGKAARPFLGVVIIMESKKYCIPLTSPQKDKFKGKSKEDFIKISDPKRKDEHGAPITIGILNLNNMIPVSEQFIQKVNLSAGTDFNRDLLINELKWCRDNLDIISNRANKLYNKVTLTPEKDRNLTRRCCDFKRLEQVLGKLLDGKNIADTPERSARMEDLLKESNQILSANPQLKKKFEELFDEYFKRCGIPPIGSSAPLPERFRVLNAIIASDPAFKAEYINARDNFRNSAPSANRKPKPPKH